MAQTTEQQDQNNVDEPQDLPSPSELPELRIYSRSNIFYWWPVWAVGFVMASITYLFGEVVTLGNTEQWIHPSRSLGIVFTFVILATIYVTSVTMRGLSSVIFILSCMFLAVLFAWLGWWDDIVSLIPQLSLYATSGFYLFFSTVMFIAWILTTFVFDRMEYWKLRPGQLSYSRVIGEAEKSYDTRGMITEKFGEDFFRHRLLGLGSGDIRILTAGARNEEIILHNVLWVDRKIDQIQRLVNVNPDDLQDVQ